MNKKIVIAVLLLGNPGLYIQAGNGSSTDSSSDDNGSGFRIVITDDIGAPSAIDSETSSFADPELAEIYRNRGPVGKSWEQLDLEEFLYEQDHSYPAVDIRKKQHKKKKKKTLNRRCMVTNAPIDQTDHKCEYVYHLRPDGTYFRTLKKVTCSTQEEENSSILPIYTQSDEKYEKNHAWDSIVNRRLRLVHAKNRDKSILDISICGMPPLCHAANNPTYYGYLQDLLAAGADPQPAIDFAAEYETLKALFNAGATIENNNSYPLKTVVNQCFTSNKIRCLKLLLAHKANVNQKWHYSDIIHGQAYHHPLAAIIMAPGISDDEKKEIVSLFIQHGCKTEGAIKELEQFKKEAELNLSITDLGNKIISMYDALLKKLSDLEK